MMRVKDLMEPIKNWLTPDMSLREAIRVMKSTKRGHGLSVNGIVVLDEAMNLVGIVSTIDILRILIPSHVYFDEDHDHISWEAIRNEKSAAIQSINVNQLMTEDVRVIAAEETLLRCADILLTEQLRRLPVTRSDGKVVGVIYLRDVYNAMIELLVN
ncbi:CBS domain-containing protein [Desulfopila sp. IMCC35006]|uniref:CBS domain-containing protein n=1 Tax=Desulfopila sp. IMCC35006 TaxID=2569542 RepID=UPI0010AD9A9E|nr:CBS domain-containing protein [Desulfopila sp. IMCC35006]TKB25073.1 CBS domain-containing protein [Desulfopila sp. IMCC35006]